MILLAASTIASAQRTSHDTVLKSSTIEVIQSYKPQIKQAPKPEWIPQLPAADTTHPTFNYEVPQQSLYYTYSSLPLRPLALGREAIKLPFPNYVKLGGGNLSTIFLDAGIGGIYGTNYETYIHVHHISQKGSIKNEQSSLSGLEADWLQHGKKSEWHTSLAAERNQYYYYGYDHNLGLDPNVDSLKQTYTSVKLGLDMKNVDNKAKFSYHPAFNASLFTAAQSSSEINVGLNLPFEYKFDTTVQALLGMTGDFAHLNTLDSSRDNTFVAVSPGIRIVTGGFYGHAVVSFAMGINNKQYLLPDIRAAYFIPDSRLTFSAGYQSTLRQNTYEQLTTENPYIFNAYKLMQTRKDELYGEIQGGVGDHFSFAGRASWLTFNDLPTYLNDIGDHKQFYIVYDSVKAVAFKISARYKVGNKWSAGASGDFYGFNNGNLQHVWHEPALKIKGDFTALIASKLTVSVYLSILGGIYAKDATHNAVLLKPVADLGGNAEYQVIPRLSAFVQLNNLLNNNYQRWYGYQAYGLNIYGGLRLKF